MRTKLIVLLLLLTAGAFAGPRGYFGVGAGHPYYGYGYAPGGYYPGPAPAAAYAPYPGTGYAWMGGYWQPYGARYSWRPGYWARPPYAGARWIAPRYYGGRYSRGYWRR